jgi:streptogramin lyase
MRYLDSTLAVLTIASLVQISACGGQQRSAGDYASGGSDDGIGGSLSGAATTGETGGAEQGTNPGSDEGSTDSDPDPDPDPETTDDSNDETDTTNGGPSPKWDTLAVPDGGAFCSIGEGVDLEFSYLWAANSGQGTISKIDTKTVTEVARYVVRPDGAGSPSRTSVSLTGDVAVASRNGGVTKIYADLESCQESNGIPGLQTSSDATYLPWALEECIAWHRPMDYTSQRPVAWGPGKFDTTHCAWEDEELWTSGTNQKGSVDVYVLDGDDGSTKEKISIPTGPGGLAEDFFGLYGGAVDGEGNFWGSQLGTNGRLVRVRREDMTYEIWDTPTGPHWYGMTVDSDGMVWLCSAKVGRFDPVTQTWATAAVGGWTGCMADAGDNGLLWMADGNGVVGVNRDTLEVEKTWPAAGSYGVSIDFEGYVWVVANGTNASKIDPETGEFWVYAGLVGAYTYSDMTGYALSNAGKPSG